MKIPRPDKETTDLFRSLVPEDDRVTIRPMFGNISAFVNGNMFFGVFGNDLFVRLSDEGKAELLKNKGASMLEPMKGKPMKDYVVLPKILRAKPEALRSWISKSLEWSSELPPKKAKNRSVSYVTFSQISKNSRIAGGFSLNRSGGGLWADACIPAIAPRYAASSLHIETPTNAFPSRSIITNVFTNPDFVCRMLRKERILLAISSSFPGLGLTNAMTTNMIVLSTII